MAKNTKRVSHTGRQYNLNAKVSVKGAISIYGFGRWPVTLYADQLIALLDKEQALRQFIEDNQAELKEKPESEGGGPTGSTAL